MEGVAKELLPKWVARKHRATPIAGAIEALLLNQSTQGFVGTCSAISGSDFYTTTASLTLPTLILTGRDDGFTPPDLVRETAGLIKGAEVTLLSGAGHLPMMECAEAYAAHLSDFLGRIGQV